MAKVYLVHGYLGAGKTTFSHALAERVDAVRLSIDEWYLRLFSDGTPTAALDSDAHARLLEVLHDHWPGLVSRGVNVVLDFGFWARSERNRVRKIAAEHGFECDLYWVRCSDNEALQRVLARNGNENAGGAFIIDESAFHALKSKYDPLGPDEAHLVVETDAG